MVVPELQVRCSYCGDSRPPSAPTEDANHSPEEHPGDRPGTPAQQPEHTGQPDRQTRYAVRPSAAQHQGRERPRLRRRGRDPAPVRGSAVVAANRPDPTASAVRVKDAARSLRDRPSAALDPAVATVGRDRHATAGRARTGRPAATNPDAAAVPAGIVSPGRCQRNPHRPIQVR